MKKEIGVVKVLLSLLTGAAAGAAGVSYFKGKVIKDQQKKVEKFKRYYGLLNQWLILKHQGVSLDKYFIDNSYKTIAIYGMGEMGNRLLEDLKSSDIIVKYAIDKEAGNTYSDIDVRDMEDELDPVDAIVVSAVFAYEEIKDDLEEKVDYPIVSLEDVIFEL